VKFIDGAPDIERQQQLYHEADESRCEDGLPTMTLDAFPESVRAALDAQTTAFKDFMHTMEPDRGEPQLIQ
jgi:hypothetical protein